MTEFFWSKLPNEPHTTSGMANFGVRKLITKHLVLMSSLGTELIIPQNEDKSWLFGLLAAQILLGK